FDTAEGQRLCAQVFKALTDTGTDARSTRRPTRLDTLGQITGTSEAALVAVIDVFRKPSRSFLMPPLSEPLTPQSAIDISHESLMRLWQRLKRWADDGARSARAYRRLRDAAAEFDKGDAGLWADPQLRLALEWRDRHQPSERWSELYGGGFASATAFLSQSREVQRQERLVAEHDARWHAVWSWVPLVTMALVFMLLQILAEPVVVSWMQDVRPGLGFWGPLASHLLTGMPAAIGYLLLAPFVRQRFPSWEARWRARKPSSDTAPQANAAPVKASESAVDLAALGYASFGRRALAELVDWTLCFLFIFVPLSLVFATEPAPPGQPDAPMSDGAAAAFMLLLLLGFGAYHVLLWSSTWRATLGMKLARIIVTDGAGYRLNPWRATGRFFARWLSYYTGGLGFLIALFSQQNKTLHDRIAGTVVLRRPAKP
ncbi:MAG: RDD family protein, partial [Microbacteriaceae bacterium]|nr:RDD family protein [Burkholderiaceae bacterium]